MEYWKSINENYSVSTMGRFWSVKNGVLKTPLMNTGYPHLNIVENGKSKRVMCHVAVANAFIPNLKNKPCVNHINGIKHDNRVENLEWVTYSENHIHAYKYLGRKGANNLHRRKTVIAYRDGLPIIIDGNGIRALARLLDIPYQAIQAGIKIPTRTYLGWKFELIDDPKFVSKSGIKY